MKRLKLYADTSVFGGCFDKEFADYSLRLFDEIRAGRFLLAISATTIDELDKAPEEVRKLVAGLPVDNVMEIKMTPEIAMLRDAYLQAGVVSASSLRDAEHIACASVADVDLIVSWNFKHIVNFEKIRGYHAVNIMRGYHPIPIYSPREVIEL